VRGPLTRAQILAADDCRSEAVEIPERGVTIRVQTMTGAAWDDLEAVVAGARGPDVEANVAQLRAALLAACVLEADRPAFFRALVYGLSADAVNRLVAAALALSGMGSHLERLTRPRASCARPTMDGGCGD
jgi:hypothetical protein